MPKDTESQHYEFDRTTRAYLVGGGIGSLAAAAFMIRDGGVAGENITIFEAAPFVGGSLDGAGDAENGYILRGGRMLTTDNYECTWDLFRTIPTIDDDMRSVYDETMEFNRAHIPNSKARVIDRHRAKVPVTSMGFSMQDRHELLELSRAEESDMGATCITDWLSPHFFETPFWFMWATTFAFQPWHSAVEFRRYLHRFIMEFSRIETLAGVKRTIYNQFDSLVYPLQDWLESRGVKIVTDCLVTRIDHRTERGKLSVTGICTIRKNAATLHEVHARDVVFLQNGSMTDSSSFGSMTAAPLAKTKSESGAWTLWERLAKDRTGFGRPEVFNSCVAQSSWESFTVTLKDTRFFDAMYHMSGNVDGTGGLVTFKDSNWLMSIVLAHQPHFPKQPANVQVFWGYALVPDRIGNFVAKPMADCNGAEILRELCGHLRLDMSTVDSAICIPCRMPYITSTFMPRVDGDRPLPVPEESRNLAFISQFVEISEDVVFTVEYSIRAAQMAVYQLFKVDRKVPPVTRHDRSTRTRLNALIKAFK